MKWLKQNWGWIIALLILFAPLWITLIKYLMGQRYFGDGPTECWGGQSCY